ncbi:hypothetical protein FBULB1_2147 [Fusarium bulbicola]|nr:hypothetical protein FBULB1_2147 [Fusarium bulbicola]
MWKSRKKLSSQAPLRVRSDSAFAVRRFTLKLSVGCGVDGRRQLPAAVKISKIVAEVQVALRFALKNGKAVGTCTSSTCGAVAQVETLSKAGVAAKTSAVAGS